MLPVRIMGAIIPLRFVQRDSCHIASLLQIEGCKSRGKLADEDFLLRLGAIARDGGDGLLHPTRAGLLMFGYEYEIAAEYPNYFLGYRESFGAGRATRYLVKNYTK